MQKPPIADLSDHGTSNDEIPAAEFEALLDEVAEDLYTHDLTPAEAAGRGAYDTPFYNGGGKDNTAGLYPSNQQVCIEDLGCSGRSEINYFAQGMWSAASGEGAFDVFLVTYAWKAREYGEIASEGTIFWAEYGFDYYQEWKANRQASEQIP